VEALRQRVASLLLDYHLEEHVALDASATYRHVERWAVSVLIDGGAEIGYVKVLVFNLEPGIDIGDLADQASGTWIDVVTASGGPGADRPDSHVLLLDRVWLDPDHRGQGLGPIVAAAVIERLGRGCGLAACFPAPFEDPSEDRPQGPDGRFQGPDDRDRAIEKLSKVWSTVGFTHWRDGVWLIDLQASDAHAALAKLLARRRPGNMP
jgi:GNAT superfamily N-acetyltransferase